MRERVIYLSFSPDARLILYSTPSQYRVLSTEGLLPVAEDDDYGGMRMIMALHANSPLFLLVPSGDKPGTSPRRVKVWNNQKRALIKELTFSTNIEAIQWNKKHLVVLLESNELQLFDLNTLKLRLILPIYPKSFTFALTPAISSPIPFNISASSAASAGPASTNETSVVRYLVYPTKEEKGSISVFECNTSSSQQQQPLSPTSPTSPSPPSSSSSSMKLVNKFQAHRTEIALLACDQEGKRVVTASKMGTIVRVFSLPAGEILYSFRIAALPIEVKAFHFCPKGQYLLVLTKHGHISLCPLFARKEKVKGSTKNSTTRGGSSSSRDREKEREAAIAAEAALLAHGVDLEISEEDGYCKIDLEGTGEEGEGEEEEGQGGYYAGDRGGGIVGGEFEDDEFDDNISVLTDNSHHTTNTMNTMNTTTTTTTIRAPAANASLSTTTTATDDPLTAVNQASQQVIAGLLDQGSSMLSSLWSVANRQNVVDLTLAGIQKVKTYSQDIFNSNDATTAATSSSEDHSNSAHSSGKEGGSSTGTVDAMNNRGSMNGKRSNSNNNNHNNTHAVSHNLVHLELDREIRRPILHFHCSLSDSSTATTSSAGSFANIPGAVSEYGRNGDGQGRDGIAVSLVYFKPNRLSGRFSRTQASSSPLTYGSYGEDDNVSHPHRDHCGEDMESQSVVSSYSYQQQEQHQQVVEVLKLLLVTKQGLLRRIDLSPFQYHYYDSPQKTNPHALDYFVSPTLTATQSYTMNEMMKYVEDERCIFD